MCSTAIDDALTLIEAGLDALAAADPEAGDEARLEKVRRLTTTANRVAALQARAVRDAECHGSSEHDGLKTMKSWMRTHTRLSGAAITALVKQGRAAGLLTAVEAAFLTGALTPDQVDTIAVIAAPENVERAAAQDVDLAVIADALVTVATTQPYTKLQVAVGTYLNGLAVSLGERKSALDNAAMESWFSSLKNEDIHPGSPIKTRLEARARLFDYIWEYNNHRLHSALGYRTPAAYAMLDA